MAELTQTREVLRNGFESINLEPGLKTLNDLVYQFDELQPVLERRREVDPLGVAHVPALADETYRQGLSVLSDALELSRALRASSPERLEQEIARLEQDLESLRGDEGQAERVRMAESRVRLNTERLELVAQQNLRVEQLLHQSDLCEAALARARLELAGLRADTAEASISAVTESLRTTMAQAREVQEELKKLGF